MNAISLQPHGFTHCPRFTWVACACGHCGFSVRWDDVQSDANDRVLGVLTPAARHTRKLIERDIRDELRSRGCPHV